MRIEIGRSIRNFVIFVAILVVMVPGVMALTSSAPPVPAYIQNLSEVITVDGNPLPANSYGEWDLTNDFFANMYNSANPDLNFSGYDELSKLYLRYDCSDGTLYALVLLEPGCVIDENNDPEEHYMKVDGNVKVDGNDNDDGFAPDFHYILNDTAKIGWEASIPLLVGSYRLNVHTQVNDDYTSAVAYREIPLVIACGPQIPEFPTIALPVAAILGLMFLFGRKRD